MDISGLAQTLVDKLSGWLETFVSMLPNLAVAAVVMAAFVVGSKWASHGMSRALRRVSSNKEIVGLLSSLTRFALLSIGLFTALGILNLDKTVTSLLAGVGIVGLALGFAFQDIAANFVSGVLMAIRHPFNVGDLVKVADHFGRVEAIDLRSTRLRELTGETVIIPNKDVFQSAIVNYTDTPCRRVDIDVGVSYADDLVRAKEIAIEAVQGIEARDGDKEIEVFYSGFGGSSIDFTLRMWITDADQRAYLAARSEAIIAIKQAFDGGGVTIPFPIRTLDFGISGGEQLREHLSMTETNVREAG